MQTDNWISIDASLPEVGTEVVVARPNPYSGKTDIIMGYLHDSGTVGRSYGRLGEGKWLYGKYWSFPAVAPLNAVSHWQPKPEPPKTQQP